MLQILLSQAKLGQHVQPSGSPMVSLVLQDTQFVSCVQPVNPEADYTIIMVPMHSWH